MLSVRSLSRIAASVLLCFIFITLSLAQAPPQASETSGGSAIAPPVVPNIVIFTITGRAGAGNVSVALTCLVAGSTSTVSTVSDANGDYSLSGPNGTNCTLTPSLFGPKGGSD